MPEQRNSLNEQLQNLIAAFHKANLSDKEQRQKLVESVNDSSLPSHHKEVLLVAFLTPNLNEVPLSLHLLRRREEMRHADALLKIESAAIGERLKRERSASSK